MYARKSEPNWNLQARLLAPARYLGVKTRGPRCQMPEREGDGEKMREIEVERLKRQLENGYMYANGRSEAARYRQKKEL